MKHLFFLLFTFSFGFFQSQEMILKNEKLQNYYHNINLAEKHIVLNKLDSALINYKKAFKIYQQPNAKDVYNSMQVAINLNKKKFANQQFEQLRCLQYQFPDGFLEKNKNFIDPKNKKCNQKINVKLKKSLDSLVVIDQKYRKLSGGDYKKYQKEITNGDSIASTKLLKLIKEYGFPNEYDIGLKSAGSDFMHQFYFIVWHQLKSNTISPQRVNFADILVKALNDGKITPENATFLYDLNMGSNKFNTSAFRIRAVRLEDPNKSYSLTSNLSDFECCYVDKLYYRENRSEEMNLRIEEKIKEMNLIRRNAGLSTIEDLILKSNFLFNNKEYIFEEAYIESSSMADKESYEIFKSRFVKYRDNSH